MKYLELYESFLGKSINMETRLPEKDAQKQIDEYVLKIFNGIKENFIIEQEPILNHLCKKPFTNFTYYGYYDKETDLVFGMSRKSKRNENSTLTHLQSIIILIMLVIRFSTKCGIFLKINLLT